MPVSVSESEGETVLHHLASMTLLLSSSSITTRVRARLWMLSCGSVRARRSMARFSTEGRTDGRSEKHGWRRHRDAVRRLSSRVRKSRSLAVA